MVAVIDREVSLYVDMYLSVVATHFPLFAGVELIVVEFPLFVPALHQVGVVCPGAAGDGNVFSNVSEGRRETAALWVVLEFACFCVALSNASQFIAPHLK